MCFLSLTSQTQEEVKGGGGVPVKLKYHLFYEAPQQDQWKSFTLKEFLCTLSAPSIFVTCLSNCTYYIVLSLLVDVSLFLTRL